MLLMSDHSAHALTLVSQFQEEAEEAKPAGKKATRGAAVRVEGRKRKGEPVDRGTSA